MSTRINNLELLFVFGVVVLWVFTKLNVFVFGLMAYMIGRIFFRTKNPIKIVIGIFIILLLIYVWRLYPTMM